MPESGGQGAGGPEGHLLGDGALLLMLLHAGQGAAGALVEWKAHAGRASNRRRMRSGSSGLAQYPPSLNADPIMSPSASGA